MVFNIPPGMKTHVGPQLHREQVAAFMGPYRPFIHAVELNGLRSWKEKREAAQFAGSAALPLISGGDRHGREPSACVDLTNAHSFAEFVSEIRQDRRSKILFMPQYRESLPMRILDSISETLLHDPGHAMGWTR